MLINDHIKGENKMIEISAYQHIGEQVIRNAQTGNPLENFQGYCMVYFQGDATQLIFKTWIDPDGARSWMAEGNNPAKQFKFV